jgi:hypothetical protein
MRLMITALSLALASCATAWTPPTTGPLSPELQPWSAYGLTLGSVQSFAQMEARGLEAVGVTRGLVYWRSPKPGPDGVSLEVKTLLPSNARDLVAGQDEQTVPILTVASIRSAWPAVSPEVCNALIARHMDELHAANPTLSLGSEPSPAEGWSERRYLSPSPTTSASRMDMRGIEAWCGHDGAVLFVQRRLPYDGLGDFLPAG